MPEGIEIGDPIEVFIYKDSQDRLIATTAEPKITLGEVKALTVADTGRIGAFLDWGLEKDLLLKGLNIIYQKNAAKRGGR